MRKGIATVVFAAFWMTSCGGMGPPPEMGDIEAGGEPAEGGIAEVPNPSASMAKKAGKSLGEIQRGHEVYMLHCGECHKYKLPQDLDIDEWETAVPKMIGHAGLESADEKAVLAYVVAVKKERGEE
jgi:mono/diheme cytochrome c family protein